MKLAPSILALLASAVLPLSAQEAQPEHPPKGHETDASVEAPKLEQWQEDFNALEQSVREDYIKKFVQAEQLFQQKRVIECLRVTEELEKLYAGNPGLYNLRGACYIEIKDIKNATRCFEKALSISPSNITFEFNLAECYFVSHEYKTAVEKFNYILKQLPDDASEFVKSLLNFKLYICYLKLDDKENSEKLEKLYDSMDDVPYYYCVQAVKQYHAGNKEEGNKAYLSAASVYHDTSMLQPYIDAMQEAGFIIAPGGQTLTESK